MRLRSRVWSQFGTSRIKFYSLEALEYGALILESDVRAGPTYEIFVLRLRPQLEV